MSPKDVTKVFNAKNNKYSIVIVILIGGNWCFGGMDISGPKTYVCTAVPYLEGVF